MNLCLELVLNIRNINIIFYLKKYNFKIYCSHLKTYNNKNVLMTIKASNEIFLGTIYY